MITLRQYQADYVAKLPAKAIIEAQTGVGKTYMSLAHYERYGEGKPLLIVAPSSKVNTGDWDRDVRLYFGGRSQPSEIHIISYEKLARNPAAKKWAEGARPAWHKFYYQAEAGNLALIADECHKAKNPQSNIGKAIFEIASRCRSVSLLSATPISNGWRDAANYFKIFGFTKNKTSFWRRYVAEDRSRGFPIILGYWHEDELARLWGGISFGLKKSALIGMPTQEFIGVDFKKPTDYGRILVTRTDPDTGEPVESVSRLASVLRQTLTTGQKLDFLSDIVDGTDENIVIFYNYKSERKAILEMLNKKHASKKIFRQDGEKHELPEKSDWDEIHNSVTLAHFKSGSTGVEMTYASITVYFSPTYSYQEYIQSIGRTHRSGQTKPCIYYCFRTKGSLEQDCWTCLSKKDDFSEKMLGV